MEITYEHFIGIIVFILSLVVMGVGWWVNQMWDMLKAQQNLLGLIQVELAKNYVPRVELAESFKIIHQKLDDIPKEVRNVIQDSLGKRRD